LIRKNKVLASLSVLLLLLACNNNVYYVKYKKVENYNWKIEEPKKFDVEIKDTTALFSFHVMLRHTGDYQYSNIYLFLNTIYPNNRLVRDTLELILADDKGQWKGSGLSNIKHVTYLMKSGIRFPQKGMYSFAIEHGMRQNPLFGVTEVGIKLEQ